MRFAGGLLTTLALALAAPGSAAAGYLQSEGPFPDYSDVVVTYVPYLSLPGLGGIYDIPAENNDVLVSHSSRYTATISERGGLMLPQPLALPAVLRNCTLWLNTATCRTSGSYRLVVGAVTRAGNDRVTVTASAGYHRVFVDGGEGNDRLTGSSGPEQFAPGSGDDVVNAGGGDDEIRDAPTWEPPTASAGADVFNLGDGDDTVHARDGIRDQIQCGAGNDTAHADAIDVVAADCETVHL